MKKVSSFLFALSLLVPLNLIVMGNSAVNAQPRVQAPDEEDLYDQFAPDLFTPELVPGVVDPGGPSRTVTELVGEPVGGPELYIGDGCTPSAGGPRLTDDVTIKGRVDVDCDNEMLVISGTGCIERQNASEAWVEVDCRKFDAAQTRHAGKKLRGLCTYGGWNYRIWMTWTATGRGENHSGTDTFNADTYISCHPLTTDPTQPPPEV